jgi:hypothetical protein
MKFSEWLTQRAPVLIEERLETVRVEQLVGARGGRHQVVGVKLTRDGQAWAIGCERQNDFVIGTEPKQLPQLGWWAGPWNGGGSRRRELSARLKTHLSESEWEPPIQRWSLRRELPVRKNDGGLMSADEFVRSVVDTFCETFETLKRALLNTQDSVV